MKHITIKRIEALKAELAGTKQLLNDEVMRVSRLTRNNKNKEKEVETLKAHIERIESGTKLKGMDAIRVVTNNLLDSQIIGELERLLESYTPFEVLKKLEGLC